MELQQLIELDLNINYKGLKSVIKFLSEEYSIKVGLLASKGGSSLIVDRNGKVVEDMDYAGLGAIHEFGKGNNPPRSFLELPLTTQTDKFLKYIREVSEDYGFEYFIKKTGDLMSVAMVVGEKAKELILEAFKTQGFGQWADNAPSTIALKGRNEPLVDTGELKEHIQYEVKKK